MLIELKKTNGDVFYATENKEESISKAVKSAIEYNVCLTDIDIPLIEQSATWV